MLASPLRPDPSPVDGLYWAMVRLGRSLCYFSGPSWQVAHKRATAFATASHQAGEIRHHPTGPEAKP